MLDHSTESDHERVEELQKAASSLLVPLRVRALDHGTFQAQVGTAGPVAAARIRSSPHLVARDARAITSTDPEVFKVVVLRQGRLFVAQDNAQRQMRPGDLLVCDTSRPYQITAPDTCEVVVIAVPRALFGKHAEHFSRRCATPLRAASGLTSLIAAFLSGLGEHIEDLPGPTALHLGDAVVSLLIAAFTETTAEGAEVATGLADRILAYARANLGDPALSVTTAARHHGISPRALHQALNKRDETFSAWIRHERLRGVQRDLADPYLAHHPVYAIAARWGFASPEHFSRTFRTVCGMSPRDFRRLHHTDHPDPHRPPRPASSTAGPQHARTINNHARTVKDTLTASCHARSRTNDGEPDRDLIRRT